MTATVVVVVVVVVQLQALRWRTLPSRQADGKWASLDSSSQKSPTFAADVKAMRKVALECAEGSRRFFGSHQREPHRKLSQPRHLHRPLAASGAEVLGLRTAVVLLFCGGYCHRISRTMQTARWGAWRNETGIVRLRPPPLVPLHTSQEASETAKMQAVRCVAAKMMEKVNVVDLEAIGIASSLEMEALAAWLVVLLVVPDAFRQSYHVPGCLCFLSSLAAESELHRDWDASPAKMYSKREMERQVRYCCRESLKATTLKARNVVRTSHPLTQPAGLVLQQALLLSPSERPQELTMASLFQKNTSTRAHCAPDQPFEHIP